MSSDDNQYSSILDNMWPPPNEATQLRLQRLRELEEQRRQHNVTSRSPPSRVRRFPSSEPIRRSRGERTTNINTEGDSNTPTSESSTSGVSERPLSQVGMSRSLIRSRSEDTGSSSVHTETEDAKLMDAFDNVPDDTQEIYDKIKQLEEKKKQGSLVASSSGAAESGTADNGISARERFFQTHNLRPTVGSRDQNRTDQIRSSRLRRRQERSQGGRYSSLTGLDYLRNTIGQGISEEGIENVRDSSLTRRTAIDTCTDAFSSLFPLEKGMKRVDELEQLRKRTQEEFGTQDSEVRLQRSHSLQTENLTSSVILNRFSSVDSAQPSRPYEPIIYGGHSLTRSASSDRLVHLREEFNLPSSTYTPSVGSSFTPSVGSSYTRPVLPDIPSSPLQALESSTEGTASATNLGTDVPDSLPVYIEGSVQGMPYVDSDGLTHWLGPTSPKYKELYSTNMLSTRRRSRDTGVSSSMKFMDGASRREAYSTSMFPDHFLAPCFEKKYTVEERCDLIRKQIYESDIGKSILAKMGERGPPDGASKDAETSDTNGKSLITENEIVTSDEQVRES